MAARSGNPPRTRLALRRYSSIAGDVGLTEGVKSREVLDDALSWARHLEESGRIPLLIEGDDGTRLDRRAIVDALRVGIREQLVR